MSQARQENRISGREKLNILYTNARNLGNMMEELEVKVDSEEYDIVAVSETWFKEENNWRTGLEGYKVYRCDTGVIGVIGSNDPNMVEEDPSHWWM